MTSRECFAPTVDSGAAAPGGGDRIRTDDRLVANQVLYQLSYAPIWVVPAWEGLSAGPSLRTTGERMPV